MNENTVLIVGLVFAFEFLYFFFGAIFMDMASGMKLPILRYSKDKPRHPVRIIVESIVNFFIRLLYYQFWILFPLYLFVKWYTGKLKDYNESRGL